MVLPEELEHVLVGGDVGVELDVDRLGVVAQAVVRGVQLQGGQAVENSI